MSIAALLLMFAATQVWAQGPATVAPQGPAGAPRELPFSSQRELSAADQMYQAGSVAVLKGDFRGAELILRDFRTNYPGDKRWGPALMGVYTSLGRTDEAQRVAREYEAKFGKDQIYHLQLGILYEKMERTEDAFAEWRTSLEMNELAYYTYITHLNMGTSYAKRGKLSEAIAELRSAKAVARQPQLQLAQLLGQHGDYEESVAEYREILQRAPNNAIALNDLAYAYAEHDEHLDEALDMSERAVDAQPGSSAMLDTLGWVLFKRGSLVEAEQTMLRALDAEFGTTGVLLGHMGSVMDARAVWTPERRELRGLLDHELTAEQLKRMKTLVRSMQIR